jgi:ATP-dependent DNA helicase RecG
VELKDLKGLGAKRMAELTLQGIHTLQDLLWQLPSSYQDSTHPVAVADLRPGMTACVELQVITAPKIQYARGLSIVRANACDASGSLVLIWFNQPWMRQLLKPQQKYLLYGRLSLYQNKLTLQNAQLLDQRGIIPRYKALGSIPGKTLAGFIEQALPDVELLFEEPLSAALRQRWDLCSLADALRQAHRPTDGVSLAMAKRRIGFDNLLLYQLALRGLQGEAQQGIVMEADPEMTDLFWAHAGFAPTGAQARVLAELFSDMQSGRSMNRLVQGDVGSGKTALAFACALAAARSGWQSALMAPTEILARQHYQSAQQMLEPLGVRCGLLLGGMKAAERREALQYIAEGNWQLVIGTQALFGNGVSYHRLGMVITDEQHRFGVRQRQKLHNKGEEQPPHVLVMSATPIPRTLALILYGDLDISIVDELPPGRMSVKTRIVPEGKRKGMYGFIRDKVAQGEQAYLVCPLAEESERVEAVDAQAMYKKLSQGSLRGLRLGLTWGSQPAEEKEKTISSFAAGHIDVLVATTVIEVGVNVPNATVMVIENAERFGLSQLHQLRGRVGRGTGESWCFLMGEPNERLDALCATNDGFVIAQKDLELRGPGDFLGTRQHGHTLPDAYGIGDLQLIEQSRAAVHQLTHEEALEDDLHRLVSLARQRYAPMMNEIAPN